MSVNTDRIRERLIYIRQQIGLLQPLADDTQMRQERMRDELSFSGVVRHLQTSIEAMIDIAFHLCAKRHAKEPESAANAFEILADHGDLPREVLRKVLEMVRFRNLVVHGYLHVQRELVEKVLVEGLTDFSDFEDIITGLVGRTDPFKRDHD